MHGVLLVGKRDWLISIRSRRQCIHRNRADTGFPTEGDSGCVSASIAVRIDSLGDLRRQVFPRIRDNFYSLPAEPDSRRLSAEFANLPLHPLIAIGSR